jgi:hypothetical protein
MDKGFGSTGDPPLSWLLERDDPSIRYRTLTELLDLPDSDGEVAEVKKEIPLSPPVRSIFEYMEPEGYWLQENPRTGEIVGEGVKYGSFRTTHFCLSYLGELGLDWSNSLVARAAERYLRLQSADGDWYGHFSCLLGYNIHTFIQLGYRDDPRVQKSIELMLNTEREDGGYLCDIHEGKYKKRSVKSCIRGSVKALLAFSLLPEYWSHPRCRALIEYFLVRGGIYRSADLHSFAIKDFGRTSMPITWRANTFEILLALSRMGYGDESVLRPAWATMKEKGDSEGKYLLDWTPTQCPWKLGDRGKTNKWVTFYCGLARKNNKGLEDG